MNPIAFLLLGVAAYALLQQQKKDEPKKAEPKKDEPKPGEPSPEYVHQISETDYTDSAGDTWAIFNPKPGDWHTNKRKIEASSRRELIEKIEKFAAKDRSELLAERRAGELAGAADAEDSAKAYKDSWTGIGVESVSKRFDKNQSDPWIRGYRQAFGDRLEQLGFATNEDGEVKKKG